MTMHVCVCGCLCLVCVVNDNDVALTKLSFTCIYIQFAFVGARLLSLNAAACCALRAPRAMVAPLVAEMGAPTVPRQWHAVPDHVPACDPRTIGVVVRLCEHSSNSVVAYRVCVASPVAAVR